MMKKMVKLNFGKWKVVKFSGSYYVNFFVEKDLFVVIDGEKFFKIKKGKLRSLGMKYFEKKKEESYEGVESSPELISLIKLLVELNQAA
jgi:hypothetical protein